MEDQRKAERDDLLKTAAEAWNQWEQSHRNPDQREWVASQVSKRCRLQIPKQRKWVSRNLKKILELVEEKHHA